MEISEIFYPKCHVSEIVGKVGEEVEAISPQTT